MIIADTHIIIWAALKPELLSKKAKEALRTANKTDGILFCEISLWEIAELSANLPDEINQDPADRIICATSIITNTELITADKNLRKSKLVNTIW